MKKYSDELEGEGLREMLINRWYRLMEWLKPNPTDTPLVQSLKMVYKGIAVLLLIALSPVIILVLVVVFVATL